MGHLNENEIFRQLDEAASAYKIPMFNNLNFPFISGRIQVYRDERTWAIVFNTLGLHMDSGIMTIIAPIGPSTKMVTWEEYLKDCTPSPEYMGDLVSRVAHAAESGGEEALRRLLEEMSGQDDAGITKKQQELYAQYLKACESNVSENDTMIETANCILDDDLNITDIVVRDQSIPPEELTPIKHVYNQMNDDEEDGSRGAYLMADMLVQNHREELLATDMEIARFFPRGLPPRFMTLDAWFHPDLAADELPSACETFQLLARAICSGNPADYAPTLPPNTDWRLWLED